MQILRALYSKISCKQLILILSFLSLLLGWRLIYVEHGWVNDDFVLYHEVARLFAIGEFKEGFKLYNWPLYPGLISALHLMTGLSLLLAAQCLNVLFFGSTTFSFLYLILLAGGEKVTIVAGALLFFSAHYISGDVVAMLVRDPGFWAFFLTSLIFFIKFCQQPSTKNALLWQIFAIIATLFRIEGLTFLVFLPFILLIKDFTSAVKPTPFTNRLYLLLQVNALNIVILLGLITLFIVSPSVTIKDLGRLQEVAALFDNKIVNVISTLSSRRDLLAESVLNGHFDDYAAYGLLITLLTVTILKIISALGWLNLGLTSYFFAKKSHSFDLNVQHILVYVLFLAFINTITILLGVMLLSTRYVVPMVLIMLIFSSFGLMMLLEDYGKIRSQRRLLVKQPANTQLISVVSIMVIFGITASFIGNILPKKTGHNFEQEAVSYLAKQAIPNEKVFFVSPRARFYAGADYAGRGYEYWDYIETAIKNQSIYEYDYLLLNMSIDEDYSIKQLLLDKNLMEYKLVKEFYGFKNKKKVMIYLKVVSDKVSMNNR